MTTAKKEETQTMTAEEQEEFRQFQAMKASKANQKKEDEAIDKQAKARDAKIVKLQAVMNDAAEELSGLGIHVVTAKLKLRHKEWIANRASQIGVDSNHMVEKIIREACAADYTKGGTLGGGEGGSGKAGEFNPVTGQHG